ncbi:retrovirus-related pol polyprotein from transposon TNT 1-94 [Tanacetum coccineum]
MNMLNRNYKMSFVKPEFLKKAQRANPRLYDIGCYNDNLALMIAPESAETIRLAQESRSKLSDLIRTFDYKNLNNLYDLFVSQRENSPEQRHFSERSKMSHTPVTNENSKEYFNNQTTLLEKQMDESISWDQNLEMVADLRYFNSLEHEVDSLKSQLETQKTQFLNEIDRLSGEYYYADHMNVILGVYTTLDKFTDLQCDYVDQVIKCERLEKELSKKQIKNHKAFKENQSNVFLKEREQYFEIQDLKAQLQDKGIAISELKKLIEKMKGKSVETKFEKSSVIRQPNAFKSQRQSVLDFASECDVNFKEHKCDLHQGEGRGSNPTTSVSRPQLKSNRLEDRVMHNISEGKKQQVEDHLEMILFIVDYGCSKHMTGNLKLLSNFVEQFLSTVKFGNDQIAPILGYGDLVQGNVTIKRVYYVEGLNYNLFSIGQFCDADLEFAFQKSTCNNRDLKGKILLKATSSQAWLCHRRLSHLNFNTINLLSKNDIVIGLPKLKFVKDHL